LNNEHWIIDSEPRTSLIPSTTKEVVLHGVAFPSRSPEEPLVYLGFPASANYTGLLMCSRAFYCRGGKSGRREGLINNESIFASLLLP